MRSRVDVEEARQMRAKGATLREIGDRFGVTRERIRQLVGTTELPATECVQCGGAITGRRSAGTRYCSHSCANKAWNARHRSPCPRCGETMGRTSTLCRSCRAASVSNEHDNAVLVELWARGESISTIAAALDTTTNSLGVRIHKLRARGYDLPYRRRVFLNGEPVYPDLEVREHRPTQVSVLDLNTKELLARARRRDKMRARHVLHAAEDRGEVLRPDSCSRCGVEARIEAHHPDYSRPLDVEWLCVECHRIAHAPNAKAAA